MNSSNKIIVEKIKSFKLFDLNSYNILVNNFGIDRVKEVFNELYNKCGNLVYKIEFSILKNKENSEDIKQIVFLKIWEINKEVFLWKKKRMKLFYLKIKE